MTSHTEYIEERARAKCAEVIKMDRYVSREAAVYFLELTTGKYTAYSPFFGPPPTSLELLRFRPCAGKTYKPLIYKNPGIIPTEVHPEISRKYKHVMFMLTRNPERLEKYWIDPTRQSHIVIRGPGDNDCPPPDYILMHALRKDPTFDPSDDMGKELWNSCRFVYMNSLSAYTLKHKQLMNDDQTWHRYLRQNPMVWNNPFEEEIDILAIRPTMYINAQTNYIFYSF